MHDQECFAVKASTHSSLRCVASTTVARMLCVADPKHRLLLCTTDAAFGGVHLSKSWLATNAHLSALQLPVAVAVRFRFDQVAAAAPGAAPVARPLALVRVGLRTPCIAVELRSAGVRTQREPISTAAASANVVSLLAQRGALCRVFVNMVCVGSLDSPSAQALLSWLQHLKVVRI